MVKIKVFTHNDLDGEGCAILFNKAYSNNIVEIERCSVNDVDSKVEKFVSSGEIDNYDTVYITDLSLKEENLIELIDKSYSDKVNLIDHHKTALWLNKYTWCKVLSSFNGVTECGTSLVGDFLSDKIAYKLSENELEFVEHIRQYDTWDWKETGNEIADKLSKLYRILGAEMFNSYYTHLGDSFDIISSEHYRLIRDEELKCYKYVTETIKRLRYKTINGMVAGVVFAERYINDVAMEIYENFDVDIAIVIDMRKERMSFRCKKDVSMLDYVVSRGGGGHSKSCGMSIDKQVIDKVLDELF